MSTITLATAKRAFRLFSHAGANKSQIRHNVSMWLKSMEQLGEKHILAKKIERKS